MTFIDCLTAVCGPRLCWSRTRAGFCIVWNAVLCRNTEAGKGAREWQRGHSSWCEPDMGLSLSGPEICRCNFLKFSQDGWRNKSIMHLRSLGKLSYFVCYMWLYSVILVLTSVSFSNNHATGTGISFTRKDGLNTKFAIALNLHFLFVWSWFFLLFWKIVWC